MSRPRIVRGRDARLTVNGETLPITSVGTHVCSPSAAVSMSLSLGMRSSVRETCTCGRTTAWISNHLGKVVALPTRGES